LLAGVVAITELPLTIWAVVVVVVVCELERFH
jgi:hypothetical protein